MACPVLSCPGARPQQRQHDDQGAAGLGSLHLSVSIMVGLKNTHAWIKAQIQAEVQAGTAATQYATSEVSPRRSQVSSCLSVTLTVVRPPVCVSQVVVQVTDSLDGLKK